MDTVPVPYEDAADRAARRRYYDMVRGMRSEDWTQLYDEIDGAMLANARQCASIKANLDHAVAQCERVVFIPHTDPIPTWRTRLSLAVLTAAEWIADLIEGSNAS